METGQRISRVSRLSALYLTPVLIVVGLKIKTDALNDGTLSAGFIWRYYATAVVACAGFGYYFARLFSRFFKPAVCVSAFVFWAMAFCYWVSFALTKNLPNESVFVTVFDTTALHTRDFLKIVPARVWAAAALYWAAFALCVRSVKPFDRQKGDGLFYGVLCAFFALLCVTTQGQDSLFSRAVKSYRLYAELKEQIADTVKNGRTGAVDVFSPETRRTIVVAVGESANRRVFNENIADFEQKTAFLKNKPVFIPDATAKHVATAYVVKDMLMPENVNLAAAYKRAGFKTFWLSNHFKSGKHDNLIYALTRNFDVLRYFNFTQTNQSFEWTSSHHDDVLIAPFAAALNDPAEKKLIFVHLFGSHFPYTSRYPDATETFILDQYAASVRYTNTVLAEILKLAEASNQNAALLYFSDHGTMPENPFERFSTVPDMIEVPMFYWLSEPYLKTPLAKSAKTLATVKKTTTSETAFIINALSGITVDTRILNKEPQ